MALSGFLFFKKEKLYGCVHLFLIDCLCVQNSNSVAPHIIEQAERIYKSCINLVKE